MTKDNSGVPKELSVANTMATDTCKSSPLLLGVKREVRKLRGYLLAHDYREILPSSAGSFWYGTVATVNIMEGPFLLGGLG